MEDGTEPVYDLPSITDRQSWCCENGCGVCHPVAYDFEYSRTEDMNGKLIESKTERVWASHCCKADLMLWDEDKQGFLDWTPNYPGCAEKSFSSN